MKIIKNIIRKFIETYLVDDEVLTDTGFQPVSKIHKTEKYIIWKIKTENGLSLECADTHIVFDKDFNEVFINELHIGDEIQTKNGLSKITYIKNKNKKVNMYDLELIDVNHRYYTNNVLSHNSTTIALYSTWLLCFSNDKLSAILANKEKVSREILGRVLECFRLVPHFLKPGVKEYNKSSIYVDNGSGIIAGATSETAIRGFSITGNLILDECAHIPSNMFDSFYESVYPTISAAKDSKIILISTPNGLNFFYEIWQGAVQGKNFYKPFTIKWNDVPGRDENWRKTEIANVGEAKFLQEYEMQFLGANNCLFTPETLQSLTFNTPISTSGYDKSFSVYEAPKQDHKYIIVSDIGEGIGQDNTVFHVIDITPFPFRQVAVYKNNRIDLPIFPFILKNVAEQYNNALVLIENNGSSKVVTNILFNEIQYENTYCEPDGEIGIRTTVSTKKNGVIKFKELVENKGLFIQDYDTIKEMSNFTKKKNSYAGVVGHTDDLVMSLVLFAFFTMGNFFKEWAESKDKDILKEMYDKKMQSIVDENFTPIVGIEGNTESWAGIQDPDDDDKNTVWRHRVNIYGNQNSFEEDNSNFDEE